MVLREAVLLLPPPLLPGDPPADGAAWQASVQGAVRSSASLLGKPRAWLGQHRAISEGSTAGARQLAGEVPPGEEEEGHRGSTRAYQSNPAAIQV